MERAARWLLLLPIAALCLGADHLPDAARRVASETPVAKETAPAPTNPVVVPPQREVSAAPPIVYVPPRRGSPRDKIAGGVRGTRALPTLLALAPDHLALTSRASPSLFWHIDAAPPGGATLVFVLEPLVAPGPETVEMELPPPPEAGIYRIRLADHGVRLEPELEYAWSVALVPGPGERGPGMLTTAYILRVAEPAVADGDVSPARYASLGLWYDALESLSDAIEASPRDPTWRSQRSDLLRQAQLDVAIE